MAERKTEDDFNPRHRIVGAVILVALAVIFLPLLLQDRAPDKDSAEPRETPVAETRDAVPPASAKPRPDVVPKPVHTEPAISRSNTRTVTVALDPIAPIKPVEKPPATTPAPLAQPIKPEPVTEATPVKPEPKAEPKPEVKPKAKAETVAATPANGWYVQVGVFSQAENARRLQDKLRAAGYSVVTDPPRIEKGKTIKVEAGPYKDQAAAKTAAARIKTDFSIDAVVRKH